MAFMADIIDNAMFAFENFGTSALGLDYLGDHNNLSSYSREFHSGFAESLKNMDYTRIGKLGEGGEPENYNAKFLRSEDHSPFPNPANIFKG
jgi:hypothetical protein